MISRILLQSRTPYLAAPERAKIENYLATVKARRAALDDVRRSVGSIVDRVITRIRAAYPQFARFHHLAFEKAQRDLGMLTNMTANAMYLGEHDTLDEMFTEWFRTILKSVHFSPQIVKDTYAVWLDELKAQLSDEAFTLIQPHAEHIADYLSRIPVPARDETGERLPAQLKLNGATAWKS